MKVFDQYRKKRDFTVKSEIVYETICYWERGEKRIGQQ